MKKVILSLFCFCVGLDIMASQELVSNGTSVCGRGNTATDHTVNRLPINPTVSREQCIEFKKVLWKQNKLNTLKGSDSKGKTNSYQLNRRDPIDPKKLGPLGVVPDPKLLKAKSQNGKMSEFISTPQLCKIFGGGAVIMRPRPIKSDEIKPCSLVHRHTEE